MTARDDYPGLAFMAEHDTQEEAAAVLDEIDRLRADLAALYLELGTEDKP